MDGGHTEVVRMLLARGADMNIANTEHGHHWTAEEYAEKQGPETPPHAGFMLCCCGRR